MATPHPKADAHCRIFIKSIPLFLFSSTELGIFRGFFVPVWNSQFPLHWWHRHCHVCCWQGEDDHTELKCKGAMGRVLISSSFSIQPVEPLSHMNSYLEMVWTLYGGAIRAMEMSKSVGSATKWTLRRQLLNTKSVFHWYSRIQKLYQDMQE